MVLVQIRPWNSPARNPKHDTLRSRTIPVQFWAAFDAFVPGSLFVYLGVRVAMFQAR
jgi:hypothetical protein